MIEEVKNDGEFRLPDICIKKYNKNTNKDRELIKAISKGDLNSMYNLLWNENVSLNVKKDHYGTDLMGVATQNDQINLIKLLMKMNLEPNNKNNYGVTPIHWAANNGNEAIIRELFNYGITVRDLEKRDEFGSTPLHFAALKNNENVVHLLISAGINPTVINNDGKRASEITSDISIKKFLKEEENKYMAEHFKKKSKKKGKKKRRSSGAAQTTTRRKSLSSASSKSSKKTSSSKPPSVSKSNSQVRKNSSISISSKRTSPSNSANKLSKKSTTEAHIPPIYNKKPVVSNAQEKSILNTTSYTMKNINQEVLNIKNSNRNLK